MCNTRIIPSLFIAVAVYNTLVVLTMLLYTLLLRAKPYNLYCVGADVKPCSINTSCSNTQCCFVTFDLTLGSSQTLICCVFSVVILPSAVMVIVCVAQCSIAMFQYYTVSQKSQQNYFCYNYVKLPPNLTIFGTKMANSLKLYEVHSFSTST